MLRLFKRFSSNSDFHVKNLPNKSFEITNGIHKGNLSYNYLRDHCRCSKCYNEGTKQRLFSPISLPEDLKVSNFIIDDQQLQINWEVRNEIHESHYDKELLNNFINYKDDVFSYIEKNESTWNRSEIVNHQIFSCNAISEDKNQLKKCIEFLLKYGFVKIENCPVSEKSVEEISKLFGPMRSTLFSYGTWNFQSKVNSEHEDMAYSMLELPGHTDGTYYDNTPYIQAFFCLYNEGQKGQTILVDSFRAINNLKIKNYEHYKFLSKNYIPFIYQEPEYKLITWKKIIQTYKAPYEIKHMIEQVRFNNEDRFILGNLSAEKVERFYEAFKALSAEIRNEELEYSFNISPGTLLLVNNWRVLHGRSEIDGNRKMCGFYMDRDYIFSKYRNI